MITYKAFPECSTSFTSADGLRPIRKIISSTGTFLEAHQSLHHVLTLELTQPYRLDRGGGKDLDLEECPRTELENERITYVPPVLRLILSIASHVPINVWLSPMHSYLSAEQRMNYLVKIDERGLLRWARNNTLIDTRANRWKDSEGGQGVVPLDGTEDRAVEHRLRRQVTTLSGAPSLSSASSDSIDTMAQAEHYGGNPSHGKIKKAFASRLTSKGITDRLLKKTVKKNTWIYAAVSVYLTGHYDTRD